MAVEGRTGLLSVLALRRNVALLLGMFLLVGMGEKMFLRFLPKYLAEVGAGPLVIGLYGFLENGLGAVYALLGGAATDRLGHRRSLVVFGVLTLVGYALLAVPWWPAVLMAVFFCSAWSQLSLPASFSMVAQNLPKGKRVMGLAMQGIIRRVPMALGPLAGGAVFTAFGMVAGMRWVVAAAAVLTILAVAIQGFLAERDAPGEHQAINLAALWRSFRPELKALLLSDILVRFCEQIPNAFVILWVIDVAGHSEMHFGIFSAIEMATAAALYIPVAYWVDHRVQRAEVGGSGLPATERGPFILVTFGFFAAFPAMLWFSRSTAMLVAAFVLRGLKEFGEPARKATIVDLAAEGMKARTVGLYYFIRDGIVAFAAMAGGALWKAGPGWNFATASACGVLAMAVYFAGARRLLKSNAREYAP